MMYDDTQYNKVTCKVCNKQYTGKTVDRFKLGWNNYKAIGHS